MNAPCTVTRVIDRVAAEIANEAKALDTLSNNMQFPKTHRENLQMIATALRRQAYQLTGRDYR